MAIVWVTGILTSSFLLSQQRKNFAGSCCHRSERTSLCERDSQPLLVTCLWQPQDSGSCLVCRFSAPLLCICLSARSSFCFKNGGAPRAPPFFSREKMKKQRSRREKTTGDRRSRRSRRRKHEKKRRHRSRIR